MRPSGREEILLGFATALLMLLVAGGVAYGNITELGATSLGVFAGLFALWVVGVAVFVARRSLIKGRELAERALRDREARIRAIMDSSSDGVMFVSRDGRIEAANGRAGELFAFNPAKVTEIGLAELLSGHYKNPMEYYRDVTGLRALLDNLDQGGEGEMRLSMRGRVLHWEASPLKDAARSTVGMTLTFRDVTPEREVERMKSDFVSFATHQLRTPLAGIKWLLELASSETADPGDARSYIRDARESAERLIRLVNELLDITVIESGEVRVVPREASLGELTRNVLDEMGPLIQEKGHRLSVNGSEQVPAVIVDPQLLRQVILHLVSNAVKYTPARGEIAIRMVREANGVVWSIRDNGVGIPNDAQQHLFEKFFRADNVKAIETEGTGLGLYRVRLIVERFEGRVWCRSEEGKGTTFFFTLPLPGSGEEGRLGA